MPERSAALTRVELTWLEKRIEHWIRFGRVAEERVFNRRARIVSFAPGSVFAFVRWASNHFGTIISRIDVVRAVALGEPYSTLPFVRPGGEILLRIAGWPNVSRVLQAIDQIEATGVNPADAAPDHWRHIPQPPERRRGAEALYKRAAQRLASTRERRLMSRHTGVLALAALGVVLSAFPRLDHPFLIWNASASVPIGLYAVERPTQLHVADLVAVTPPEPLAKFLADRGYLPRGLPLPKRVQALSGQSVCRNGFAITIDGAAIDEARERESRGRSLPSWQGCRVVRADEVFLMNPRSADSFDGRYFGPPPASSVIGRAIPLWTTEED